MLQWLTILIGQSSLKKKFKKKVMKYIFNRCKNQTRT